MAKRFLALLVMLAMVISVAAACAGNNEGQKADTTTSQADTTQKADDQAPATTEKKELEISVGFGDAEGFSDADDFGKFIQNKFKMKITIMATDASKIAAMAASGDLPDVFAGGVGDALFNSLKSEGLLKGIPDGMLEMYPSVKKVVELNDATMAIKKMTGKLYAIPRPSNADRKTTTYNVAMYYRDDWARKLGISPPTTMDELYVMMKAFSQNDPDGDNQNNTFGTSGWIWSVQMASWVDFYQWVKEDGKWIPAYISNAMVPAISYWNKLYKEKILDNEFSVANDKNLFYNNKIGLLFANADEYWLWANFNSFKATHPEGDPMEAVKLLPPLKADASSEPRWLPRMEDGCSLFSAKMSDEKLERILELFEWQLSPEGRDFINYGFMDKDYTIKDGKVLSLLPMNETKYNTMKTLAEVYPSTGIGMLLAWKIPATTPSQNPPIPVFYTELHEKLQTEVYGSKVHPMNIFVNNVVTPAKDKYNVTWDVIEGEIHKMISGKDPAGDFEKFKTKLLKVNGLEQVIEEVNKVVAEQGLDR